MAFFNASTTTSAAAAQQIADAAGASADNQMTARAGISLRAAYEHFNNYANWEFTLVEAPTIVVTAPFSPLVPGGGNSIAGSATGGGTSMSFAVGNVTGFGILVDDFITGPVFANNSAGRVTATATAGVAPATTATIGFAETFNASLISSAGATAFITANRDFYDIPADWKQPYSVRMLGQQYTLRPIGRRLYDRSVTSEFTPAGTPLYYDIFGIGTKGKIRLLRPPFVTDRMQLRYYKRMQSSAATLDIPASYEPYLLAWGKWHFLMDKADGLDRANGWMSFAKEGIAQMLKESVKTPDDDIQFLPGHYSTNIALGPNSVREYLTDGF